MKKIALVAAATLALAACTGSNETNEAANDTADYNLTTENAIEDANAAVVDGANAADAALDNAAADLDNAAESVENAADAVEANAE